MTPDEYEHLVAHLLAKEGWDVEVTAPSHDLGIDVLAERDGVRLGVQAKMFRQANRPVNAEIVMHTHGAAAYFDCHRAMVATDGRVLDEARRVADKLGVELWIVPANPLLGHNSELPARPAGAPCGFGKVWCDYVEPLAGSTLRRADGSSNVVVAVDSGGVLRRTSNDKEQRIPIEIFRWAIERLLAGETVLRDDINAHSIDRVSSGVMLILTAVPLFEQATVGRKRGLRMRSSCP